MTGVRLFYEEASFGAGIFPPLAFTDDRRDFFNYRDSYPDSFMRYPTIWQYIESIANPDGLFGSLLHVEAGKGEASYSSGSYGTVFPIQIEGKPCALKCFTRHQPGRTEAYRRISAFLNTGSYPASPYLVPFRWLDDELLVFDDTGYATAQSLLLMEWVEGKSLTAFLDQIALDGKEAGSAFERISREFDRMALWLLEQPFAHGDLKPDNLIVRIDPKGNEKLVLIDYDGLYLPDMAGERAREMGTEGFRHPARSENGFGKWIDDYSIALLSLSFRALSHYPELYARFHEAGLLIFRPGGILAGTCPAYNFLRNTELVKDPLFEAIARSKDGPIEGLADMLRGEKKQTKSGQTSFPYFGTPSPEGLCLCKLDEKYGFATPDGLPVIPPCYDRAMEFSEGVAAVCQEGKWGYINTHGELKRPGLIYQACGPFSEGLAAVCRNGKWGYVDASGVEVIPCRFEDAWPFSEGKGLVKRRGKFGFIGPDNRMAIPTRYDFGQSFREGSACVIVDGLYGYIDPKGRYLIRPMFDYARSKRDGKAYVESQGKGREIEL